VEMKEMGVGLATAVFLDAMIIRVLVLPSLMTLLGGANWWPSRMPVRPATGTERHGELVGSGSSQSGVTY